MITLHTMCLPDYSEDFKEFALTIMNEHHFPEPNDVNSALDLYETPQRGGKVNIIFLKAYPSKVFFHSFVTNTRAIAIQ